MEKKVNATIAIKKVSQARISDIIIKFSAQFGKSPTESGKSKIKNV